MMTITLLDGLINYIIKTPNYTTLPKTQPDDVPPLRHDPS